MFIFKIPAVPVNCTKISMIKNYVYWFRIRLSFFYRETIRQRENYQKTNQPFGFSQYLCTLLSGTIRNVA